MSAKNKLSCGHCVHCHAIALLHSPYSAPVPEHRSYIYTGTYKSRVPMVEVFGADKIFVTVQYSRDHSIFVCTTCRSLKYSHGPNASLPNVTVRQPCYNRRWILLLPASSRNDTVRTAGYSDRQFELGTLCRNRNHQARMGPNPDECFWTS
jgi:hypothetical protein